MLPNLYLQVSPSSLSRYRLWDYRNTLSKEPGKRAWVFLKNTWKRRIVHGGGVLKRIVFYMSKKNPIKIFSIIKYSLIKIREVNFD